MNDRASHAQPGVLSDPTTFAEYLTFTLIETPRPDAVDGIADDIIGIAKSIGQKDPSARLSMTLGISNNGWKQLLPGYEMPQALMPFEAMHNGDSRVG